MPTHSAGQFHDHAVLWEEMPMIDLHALQQSLQQYMLNLPLIVHTAEDNLVNTDSDSMPDLVSEADSDLSDLSNAETVLAERYVEVD